MNDVQAITREDLVRRLAGPMPPALFEALPEPHFAAGHIPGAVAMPLDRIGEVAARHAPGKDREIVVYCSSTECRNSKVAARKLAELGYGSVRVFPGGKAEWKDSGLALEVTR